LFILIKLGEEYKSWSSSLCSFLHLPVLAPSVYVPPLMSEPSFTTTGKIIVLRIVIFKFFNSGWEDRRFWSEW
jgi:hypothetical protein